MVSSTIARSSRRRRYLHRGVGSERRRRTITIQIWRPFVAQPRVLGFTRVLHHDGRKLNADVTVGTDGAVFSIYSLPVPAVSVKPVTSSLQLPEGRPSETGTPVTEAVLSRPGIRLPSRSIPGIFPPICSISLSLHPLNFRGHGSQRAGDKRRIGRERHSPEWTNRGGIPSSS